MSSKRERDDFITRLAGDPAACRILGLYAAGALNAAQAIFDLKRLEVAERWSDADAAAIVRLMLAGLFISRAAGGHWRFLTTAGEPMLAGLFISRAAGEKWAADKGWTIAGPNTWETTGEPEPAPSRN